MRETHCEDDPLPTSLRLLLSQVFFSAGLIFRASQNICSGENNLKQTFSTHCYNVLHNRVLSYICCICTFFIANMFLRMWLFSSDLIRVPIKIQYSSLSTKFVLQLSLILFWMLMHMSFWWHNVHVSWKSSSSYFPVTLLHSFSSKSFLQVL